MPLFCVVFVDIVIAFDIVAVILLDFRSKQKYGAIVNLCPLPLFQANNDSSCDASMKKSERIRSFCIRSASLKKGKEKQIIEKDKMILQVLI